MCIIYKNIQFDGKKSLQTEALIVQLVKIIFLENSFQIYYSQFVSLCFDIKHWAKNMHEIAMWFFFQLVTFDFSILKLTPKLN